MIRLSRNARPESWHTVQIPVDGEPTPMRVRYWLLSTKEAAQWARERLKGYAAVAKVGSDGAEALEFLLGELDPERIDAMSALLTERIVDWDLADGDSVEDPPAKLPVTPETLAAVLERGDFLRPLFQGLLDASSGAARKNA